MLIILNIPLEAILKTTYSASKKTPKNKPKNCSFINFRRMYLKFFEEMHVYLLIKLFKKTLEWVYLLILFRLVNQLQN